MAARRRAVPRDRGVPPARAIEQQRGLHQIVVQVRAVRVEHNCKFPGSRVARYVFWGDLDRYAAGRVGLGFQSGSVCRPGDRVIVPGRCIGVVMVAVRMSVISHGAC